MVELFLVIIFIFGSMFIIETAPAWLLIIIAIISFWVIGSVIYEGIKKLWNEFLGD